MDAAKPVRGRPRSEAAERAILEVAVRLLEEGVPLADISIERIARTAGVGKATIYRRWPGKEELFADAIRRAEPADPPLTGASLREDLIALLEAQRLRGVAKRSSALLHTAHAQLKTHPRLWDAYHATVVEPRVRLTRAVLQRGQERGEIRADLDVDFLNDLFVGPMLVRTVLRPEAELPDDFATRIVDALLAGLSPAQ
ncbi:TetR/AcrR family transcriptional regulator [Streptomyces sp. JNUCC 64]